MTPIQFPRIDSLASSTSALSSISSRTADSRGSVTCPRLARTICAKAIRDGWDARDTELALLRADRPKPLGRWVQATPYLRGKGLEPPDRKLLCALETLPRTAEGRAAPVGTFTTPATWPHASSGAR